MGGPPALGDWAVDAAPPLEWGPGHTWSADLALPAGEEVTFKLVAVHGDGGFEWEPGPDRAVRLPGAAAHRGASGGTAEVVCVWGSTGSTGLASTDDPPAADFGDLLSPPVDAAHPPSAAPLEGEEEAQVTAFAVWPAGSADKPPLQTPDGEAAAAAAKKP